MSDHELTDEQLDELERDMEDICSLLSTHDGFPPVQPALKEAHGILHSVRDKYRAAHVELRALRKLRDEVEPVLREGKRCLCPNMMQESFEGHLPDCLFVRARNILARHYDKKEPTK